MKKPNIVFILIDDMGYRDLGASGSTFYETPIIDKLCAEGAIFNNAYASCPVCSPSRVSYLTGRYPARVGITDWIDFNGFSHPLKGKLIDAPYIKELPVGSKTVSMAFKENGYSTWHVGKWHMGGGEHLPENFGFDVNIGGCEWGSPQKGYFSPYHIKTLEDKVDGEYLTDRLTDEAINLIKNQDDKPFYLSLCHYTVHTPVQAKQDDINYFIEKAKRQKLDTIDPLVEGEEFHTEDKKGKRVTRRIIQSNPVYAAMIKNLDDNIGRLLDTLKETGKADDTVIVFTSDNGGLSSAETSPTCNLPAREGKGWVYDGGVRVPMFVWYPKEVKQGMVTGAQVTSTDIYPTLLEMAGLDLRPEEHVDGRSFKPTLLGEKQEPRPLFWHYPHYGNQGGTPGSSVVFGDYKLIEFFEDNRTELYNIGSDIGEIKEISKQEPEKTAKLYKMLKDWQDDVCAVFPQVNKEYAD